MNTAVLARITLLLAFCLGVATAPAEVITGEIAADRTLSGTNTVQGTVQVRPGVTLTLTPGTTMLMAASAGFDVRGKLIADGTEAAPITFTRETTAARWSRVIFKNSAANRFRHCIFEFANCAGTHLDYYDNDCNPDTTPPPRTYHEAIVLLASEVKFERCIFRNLPDDSASAEGDALAIISDDPQIMGASTAHIDGCQFIGIGQGVHTRFSHVLVENCFFTGHHGDNDDIDMYGESTPPPLIRWNRFIDPVHDDMINPTRCSAVIIGNIVSGGDDHGIVLRDKCAPIVMGNLIMNCAAAAISVQNQCDALIVNNTILNSARGVRFFDHNTRWDSPYCLFPGSGRATLINNIIRNCTNSLTLADSPYTEDRGSHAAVYSCNIQGGQPSATVSANSTLTWGAGNIDVDPQFTAGTSKPAAGSPMIDAAIDPRTLAPALSALAPFDPEKLPRPLDGNGDGTAAFDFGAYEFLLATADSNGDGIPDGWVNQHGFSPLDSTVSAGDPDGDGRTTFFEWLADTSPRDPGAMFRVESIRRTNVVELTIRSSTARRYTLESSPALTPTATWTPVPGQVDIPGNGALLTLSDSATGLERFYRVSVRVPPTGAQPVSPGKLQKRTRRR